jgi:hypothetical protein
MRNYRLGLNHVPQEPSRLLSATLSTLVPPDAVDWEAEALKRSGIVAADGNARGNADHSCCVVDGAFQSIRVRRAIVAGDGRDFDWPEVDPIYREWSGYDGSDATDQGTNSEAAALLWEQKGLRWGQDWLDVPTIRAINPANIMHVKSAVAFLGPTQIDLGLPLAWQQEQSTWTVIGGSWGQPSTWGDHRVLATGYTSLGLVLLTWGLRRLLTWPALALYGLGAEATVSRSWLDTMGVSPAGLDLDALEREGRAVAA